MKARHLRWLMNVWPPFLFSGIRVEAMAADYSVVQVGLRLRWYNRNYVDVHFGGSLFAMTDPFWMLMVMQRIGPGYVVWDKAAQIDFVKPGRGRVVARFELDPAVIDELRGEAEAGRPVLRWFETEVVDAHGDTVARVRKQLYVRRKPLPAQD